MHLGKNSRVGRFNHNPKGSHSRDNSMLNDSLINSVLNQSMRQKNSYQNKFQAGPNDRSVRRPSTQQRASPPLIKTTAMLKEIEVQRPQLMPHR